MGMEHTGVLTGDNFVNMAFNGFDELWMLDWRVGGYLLLGF
jgi:hypothetical protein